MEALERSIYRWSAEDTCSKMRKHHYWSGNSASLYSSIQVWWWWIALYGFSLPRAGNHVWKKNESKTFACCLRQVLETQAFVGRLACGIRFFLDIFVVCCVSNVKKYYIVNIQSIIFRKFYTFSSRKIFTIKWSNLKLFLSNYVYMKQPLVYRLQLSQ